LVNETRLKRSLPIAVAAILSTLLLLSGCISPKRTPNLARIFAGAREKNGKLPVIVIPGVLGTELINSRTGAVDWPSVFRSDDADSSLPISPDLARNRDSLVPGKIIETVSFGKLVPEVYVYRDLLEALRRFGGYREGDWNNPTVDGDRDTFYVFAYDWRRDNVENARELISRIEKLKTKLNRPDLKFNVLAHSMGGLIARYAAMYGNKDLPPDGSPMRPDWLGAAHFSKIVMLGVPNEGSADAFATLLFGYSITEGLRRRVPLLNKLTAEDAITSPALFQLLPHGNTKRFLNEELKTIPVDLYNPDTWKQYGWSVIADPEFRRKYAHKSNGVTAAQNGESSLGNLDAYLAAVLKRAKRFHEALDAPSPVEPPVTFFGVGGDCEETLYAPVLLRDKKGNWLTLIRPREFRTSTGRRVTKQEVTEAMYAPGDGRVTRESLVGHNLFTLKSSSGSGTTFAVSYAVFGCDLHGQLQRNQMLQDNALTALINEVIR
jgi:pimeloyl-ACP methyl ester carboxylesterase